jgi:hypothetical protein
MLGEGACVALEEYVVDVEYKHHPVQDGQRYHVWLHILGMSRASCRSNLEVQQLCGRPRSRVMQAGSYESWPLKRGVCVILA